jgi:amino acid transporter
MIITVLISLINIGSTTALGAMFSIANSAWISSYAITIGCGLYRRLFSLPLPEPRFSLGKWSVLINIGALIFLLPIFVICFFPPVPLPQLTATSMNWGISMYGGITILSTIYYIVWGRHVYTPPNYDDDGELEEKENVEMKSEIDTHVNTVKEE